MNIERRPNDAFQRAERSLSPLANKATRAGTYARSKPFVNGRDEDACLEADRELVDRVAASLD
ncbi:hypothetical protein [Streptomyces sp. NPDC000134]|uniref:hypothetical protein n=1 Tax=Streptomyces sp. NPDC000134 TaxID=3364536 RepID=UPI0036758146